MPPGGAGGRDAKSCTRGEMWWCLVPEKCLRKSSAAPLARAGNLEPLAGLTSLEKLILSDCNFLTGESCPRVPAVLRAAGLCWHLPCSDELEVMRPLRLLLPGTLGPLEGLTSILVLSIKNCESFSGQLPCDGLCALGLGVLVVLVRGLSACTCERAEGSHRHALASAPVVC